MNEFQFVIDVSFQLDSFNEYLNLTERLLHKEISEKIGEWKRFLDTAHEIQIENEYDFEDHVTKIHTQELYYNSIFISLYSFLETKMLEICKLAEPKQKIKINDFGGNGIFKFHKYCEKVLDIDMKPINKEWSEINKYNKFRNIIVHEPSNELRSDNVKKITTLSQLKHLEVVKKDDVTQFTISDVKFLLEFKKIIGRYLRHIYYD